MTTSKGEGVRAFLRPPMGNNAFYSREYLSLTRNSVMKAWATPGNSLKREVALTLLADPELRLRICHLEEILRARQLAGRLQANGFASSGAVSGSKDLHPVQLQTVLADPSYSALFELDASVNDPDWGMQVLWLNMAQLQKELGLPAPANPPPPQSSLKPTIANTDGDITVTAATAGAAAAAATASTPVPDPTLLGAVEAAFPGFSTDDEEYLAVAASFCLASWRDPKGLLPALSLHLTDLTAHLGACALSDPRLAAVLQRIAVGAAAAASPRAGAVTMAGAAVAAPNLIGTRLAELLASPRARMVFRQSESLSRKGERVVSIALEQLMRLTGGGGGGRAGTGRVSLSNGALPYELWRRAGAGSVSAAANGAAAAVNGAGRATDTKGADTLPVFLFEYEAPCDVNGRDDMAAPVVTQRDRFGTAEIIREAAADGGAVNGSSSSVARVGGGSATVGGQRDASSAGVAPGTVLSGPPPSQIKQPPQQQQQQQQAHSGASLQHAWSDGAKPSSAALPLPQLPHHLQPPPSLLQSMASEPMPLRGGDTAQFTALRLQPPAASDGGCSASSDPYGLQGLVLGAAWPTSSRSLAAEGGSPSGNNLGNGFRLPLYHNGGCGGGAAASADALVQQTIAAAATTANGPVTTTSVALAASPAASELLVPQEIAEVWSNSAAASSLSAGRGSMTAGFNVNGADGGLSALPADGSLGGIFAMSPTQESSYLERLAARTAFQPSNRPMGRSGAPASGATDLGAFGLGGLGLGGFVNTGGPAILMGSVSGGVAASGGIGGPLIVGSAPTVSMPAIFNGGMAAAAGGLGLGGSTFGGGGAGAIPMEYASWQSSPPELSSSVSGRSAPADRTAAALDSWMLSYGTRVNGGGVAAAASIYGVNGLNLSGPANAGGVGNGGGGGSATATTAVGPDGRGIVASRTGTGPAPSVSEEGEEAPSVVGGLELDPMALTLEAIIGFDPSSQLDSMAVSRRASIHGPPGSSVISGKGLIAAAAAPKLDAIAITATATNSGSATPPSTKSFTSLSGNSSASAAATFSVEVGGGGGSGSGSGAVADGSSHHSSLDSCEVLNGGGANGAAAVAAANAAVLSSWSSLAARGSPTTSPSAAHHHAASMQLAVAAAAAASGGRVSVPQLQHSLLSQHGTTVVAAAQGLAATMAAMGGGALGASHLTMGRQSSLSHGGAAAATTATAVVAAPGGMVGLAALPSAASSTAPLGRDMFGSKGMHVRLSQRIKEEICQLIRTVPGLKVEDFDDGVLHQLTLKKSEEEAVGALRTLAAENLNGIQHMAAYINHIIKNYHLTGGMAQGPGVTGAAAASLPSATVRANSTPVSSKAILQKLPLRVYKRLEEVINRCSYMEWKHFDAGVVKVMAQLSEIGEDDVFEELELLKSTDLSNVEYMPAYLNKRLNNRLWSRRKLLTSAAAAASVNGGSS
ncbi:hypothetical protein Vafri_13997 [Volvox africanus]|uniref:Uncharacterized protein n=1 Tax=Volvox africanus TaxID=51714 RepID=A0A8J4BDE4_9CHLO|nr:hypothetical protein Vafri_13997 [Volvox africanus]